jgi:hypothetical protein
MKVPAERDNAQLPGAPPSHIAPVAPTGSLAPPTAVSSLLPGAAERRTLCSPSKETGQPAAQNSASSFTPLALVQLLLTLRHLHEKVGHQVPQGLGEPGSDALASQGSDAFKRGSSDQTAPGAPSSTGAAGPAQPPAQEDRKI